MYDTVISPGERNLFAKVRPRLVGDLTGAVLEVGAGTGLNFPHYPAGLTVVATEPDPFMRKHAQERLQERGRPGSTCATAMLSCLSSKTRRLTTSSRR
jgi:hypothetical protein